MKYHKKITNQAFTIIELMIAISIFSIILLISSIVIISIANLSTKGNILSLTDNLSANALQAVVSSIRYNGQPSNNSNLCTTSVLPGNQFLFCQSFQTTIGGQTLTIPIYAYCIGQNRFSFVVNREMISQNQATLTSSIFNENPTYHALYQDTLNSSGNCMPVNLLLNNPENGPNAGTNGKDLLSTKMRVLEFNISTPSPNQTSIFNVSLDVAYGDDDTLNLQAQQNNLFYSGNCLNQAGQRFCATAILDSTTSPLL